MYLLHTHQPMQVPHPGPSMFCAFAHSPQTPRASPVPLPLAQGSGMDRGHLVWNLQGVPLTGPSPPPSQSHLVHYSSRVSWLCLALGGSEGHHLPPQNTHTMGGNAASLPQPDESVQDAGGLTLMGRTLTLSSSSPSPAPKHPPTPNPPPP